MQNCFLHISGRFVRGEIKPDLYPYQLDQSTAHHLIARVRRPLRNGWFQKYEYETRQCNPQLIPLYELRREQERIVFWQVNSLKQVPYETMKFVGGI